MKVHNNSDTIPDRYTGRITKQDSIQGDNLSADRLCFRKVRIAGEVLFGGTGTGDQAANTYYVQIRLHVLVKTEA